MLWSAFKCFTLLSNIFKRRVTFELFPTLWLEPRLVESITRYLIQLYPFYSPLFYSHPTLPTLKGALVLLLTLIVIDQLKEILHSLVFDQSYIFFLLLIFISLFCISTYRDQAKSEISPTQLFCIWSPLYDFPPVLESR